MSEYTLEEISQHSKQGDCWLVFQGGVYDVSKFDHPGGAEALLKHAGTDATAAMFKVSAHGENLDDVHAALEQHKIGVVKSA